MSYNKRINDITCICGAYDHPHRLGGGSCTGSEWCESFRSIDAFDCESCSCSNNDTCDVVTGLESINRHRCECIATELRSRYIQDEYGCLPLDLNDYLERKQMDYYENDTR